MKTLVAEALRVAASQKGVVEEAGANRGRQVGKYLASVGLGQGHPWCAAFVYWCIDEAARELGQSNPFIRTAGCAVIDAWAQNHDIRESKPEKGDVFLRRGTVNGVFRACHTGFVTDVDGASFGTWEGNTNLDGSREGFGVFARRRVNGDRFSFVRWSRLVEEGGAAASEPALPTYELVVGGGKLCDMPVQGGRALCPIRLWGERLGFEVGWNQEEQVPLFDGKEILTEIVLLDGKAYAPIRDLVESAGLQLKVDIPKRRVEVVRLLEP